MHKVEEEKLMGKDKGVGDAGKTEEGSKENVKIDMWKYYR